MLDIVDCCFKRFRIVVILFYANFLFFYLISLLEGNTKEVLEMVIVIYDFVVAGFIWYYLWNCAKLVGKKPLHYLLLAMFFNIFGPLVTYLVLKKASLSLSPVIREETDAG